MNEDMALVWLVDGTETMQGT